MMSNLIRREQLPQRMPIAVRTRLAIVLTLHCSATPPETAFLAFLQEPHFGLAPKLVPNSTKRWHRKRRLTISLGTLFIFIPAIRDAPSHMYLHLSPSGTSQR